MYWKNIGFRSKVIILTFNITRILNGDDVNFCLTYDQQVCLPDV